MLHLDHEQGSPEWLESRRGVITGSKFKEARERVKSGAPSAKALLYAQDLARERCGGTAGQRFQNAAMRYGTEQESFARTAYERKTGALVEPVGFFKTDDGLFGLSPDGLIDDDGVLEIKTMVSSDTFFTAVVNKDFSGYTDQCNGYLWLLGRQWVDLVLWAPDMAEMGMALSIHRITRDEAAIEKLEADLLAFAKTVTDFETKLRAAAPKELACL